MKTDKICLGVNLTLSLVFECAARQPGRFVAPEPVRGHSPKRAEGGEGRDGEGGRMDAQGES